MALPPPVAHVRRTVLPSGVRVLTDTVDGANSATISVWVGIGGRDEPDELVGASHFLEHLLFKGTHTRTARELSLQIDGVGGEMNAYTASEYTSFYARVPAVERAVATDLVLDVVTAPALRADDVDSEREVILEELAAAEDDPEDLAAQRLFAALFPGHPLGREVLGTGESISALTRDQIAGFFDAHYRAANMVVTGAGGVDHDELVAAVAERLDRSVPGDPVHRQAPPPADDVVVTAHDPGEMVQLNWGWRTAGAHDPDRVALSVLNHVLGAGPSSRLFQQVREERGLTYSISSGISQYSDGGALTVGCATSPSKAAQVVQLVHAELESLAARGITGDELLRAQRSLRGAMLLGLEDSGSRGGRLGLGEMLRGSVTPIEEYLSQLADVEVDQVARVAQQVLGGPRVISLVGPGDLDRLVA